MCTDTGSTLRFRSRPVALPNLCTVGQFRSNMVYHVNSYADDTKSLTALKKTREGMACKAYLGLLVEIRA